MACNSCKLCTRDMPAPDAPRGVTRHRQLGRTLDPWGVFAGSSVGGVRWSLLSPCDELVGIHAGLYDALGEPLEGVGSLLDSFTARRQISQIEWPRGVGINGLPFDGATWSRYRQVQDMRVTTGAIRASASRAREAYFDNFGRGWGMPGDFQSSDYAPEVVVMYSFPVALDQTTFGLAFDYRAQAYCEAK